MKKKRKQEREKERTLEQSIGETRHRHYPQWTLYYQSTSPPTCPAVNVPTSLSIIPQALLPHVNANAAKLRHNAPTPATLASYNSCRTALSNTVRRNMKAFRQVLVLLASASASTLATPTDDLTGLLTSCQSTANALDASLMNTTAMVSVPYLPRSSSVSRI